MSSDSKKSRHRTQRQPSSSSQTGSTASVPSPPRQRFSFISFFTSSRNRKTHQRLSKSHKSAATSVVVAEGASACAGPSCSDSVSHGEGRGATAGDVPLGGAAAPPHSPLSVAASVGYADGVSVDTLSACASSSSLAVRECPICLEELPLRSFPTLSTCGHRSCETCLGQYLRTEISESRVHISCPECAERLRPHDIQRLLHNDRYMLKWEEFMLRRVLVADPDTRWCPAPDCGYAVIASGCANCPRIRCMREGCDTHFCYHCKQEWHPNQTCDAARKERIPNMRVTFPESISAGHKEEVKPCPRCKSFIIKMDDGSCNHMTCAVCGSQFCWLCMKEISDLHFLSPSGCTFWGKKPWSRKKKLIWQLTILIGAPVGITVMAALTVPVFIVGIPVWAGRKLFHKYRHSNKHKRNLLVAGGATLAFTTAPVVAAVAVAIGVPILLTYIYGVVPISLCRSSGGCGLTADGGGGLNFEFEEPPGEGQQLTNPSIGPSIGEAASIGPSNSLSASGSHIDRLGMRDDQSDRDWASSKAMVGTSLAEVSLNGSLYDHGDMGGPSPGGPISGSAFVTLHRMETKAEVSYRGCTLGGGAEKRGSITSESPSVLDSSRAGGPMVFVPADSMKGLAGSIYEHRDKDAHSMVSAESDFRGSAMTSSSMAVKSRSNHGSPVSNRSVTFAAFAPSGTSMKRSKRGKKGAPIPASERSSADKVVDLSVYRAKSVSSDTSSVGSGAPTAPLETGILKKSSTACAPQHEVIGTGGTKPVFNSLGVAGGFPAASAALADAREEAVGSVGVSPGPVGDADTPGLSHQQVGQGVGGGEGRRGSEASACEPGSALGNIIEERKGGDE